MSRRKPLFMTGVALVMGACLWIACDPGTTDVAPHDAAPRAHAGDPEASRVYHEQFQQAARQALGSR